MADRHFSPCEVVNARLDMDLAECLGEQVDPAIRAIAESVASHCGNDIPSEFEDAILAPSDSRSAFGKEPLGEERFMTAPSQLIVACVRCAIPKSGITLNSLRASGSSEVSANTGPSGRRVSVIDRPWRGTWSAFVVMPVDAPSAQAVQALLTRLLREHPSAALASRVDADRYRWQMVPHDDHRAHVARVVVAAEDPEPDRIDEFLLRHLPPLDSNLPLLVLVGRQSMTVFMNHFVGDAATFSQLLLKLTHADYEGVVALEPRATSSTALRALLGQVKPHYRQWLRHASRSTLAPAQHGRIGLAKHAATIKGEVAAKGPPSFGSRPMFAGAVITNAELRELTRWRNECARGVSITALLTTAVYRSLVQHDLNVNGRGYYLLIDIRRYLPRAEKLLTGNLAKGPYLSADMSSLQSVFDASQLAIESALAVPATVASATKMLLGRKSESVQPPEDGPPTIAFSSMPTLPGLAELPWTDPTTKRHFVIAFPTGPRGISIFAVRLRDHMEITASFDESIGPVGAVRSALAELGDAPGLLSDA